MSFLRTDQTRDWFTGGNDGGLLSFLGQGWWDGLWFRDCGLLDFLGGWGGSFLDVV